MPFRAGFLAHGINASDIAARSVEAGNEAKFDWVAASSKDYGNCRGCGLSGEYAGYYARRYDHRYMTTDQTGR